FSGVLGPEGNEFLRHTVEGAVRMDELLQSLRVYTRLFETEAEEAPSANTARVLERVLEALRPAIEESGAVIRTASLPPVAMPEFQMEQLFLNLVGNAIRYRQGAPEIQIDAVRQDGHWLFSVRDNGIGIEPRFQEQIFEMFKRLHSHSEYPGTGMGLAICQRIVERTKGRIWVESEPGKGSTFYFTVPCRNAHEKPV